MWLSGPSGDEAELGEISSDACERCSERVLPLGDFTGIFDLGNGRDGFCALLLRPLAEALDGSVNLRCRDGAGGLPLSFADVAAFVEVCELREGPCGGEGRELICGERAATWSSRPTLPTCVVCAARAVAVLPAACVGLG